MEGLTEGGILMGVFAVKSGRNSLLEANPKIVVFNLRRLNVKEKRNQSVSLSDFLCLVRTGTMGASLTIS
jgi:hypothetical protein